MHAVFELKKEILNSSRQERGDDPENIASNDVIPEGSPSSLLRRSVLVGRAQGVG